MKRIIFAVSLALLAGCPDFSSLRCHDMAMDPLPGERLTCHDEARLSFETHDGMVYAVLMRRGIAREVV